MSDAAAEDRGQVVARLYDAHGARLYRYALMILADRGDAEDAIQQVFAAVVADSSLALDNPEAYLRTAVRNASFTILRRRRTAAPARMLEPIVPECSRAEQAALEQALARLPPEQREVVHLHVYEGMTFREVAAATGESINTVAARYRYAVAKLREELA